ncbi:MAG: hypothetical protein WD069_17930 [Planctomycetales bacterium]
MKTTTIFGILAGVACGPWAAVDAADIRFDLPRKPDAITTTAIEYRPVSVTIEGVYEARPSYCCLDVRLLDIAVKWRNDCDHSIWVVGDSVDAVEWRVERRAAKSSEWFASFMAMASPIDLHEVAPGALHEFRAIAYPPDWGQEIRIAFDYFEQPRIIEQDRRRAVSPGHRVDVPLKESGNDR